MEEREHSCKTCLKCFLRFSSDLKVFDYLYRDQCKNYKWCKKIIYHWRDHGKSLCAIWFFVIHSKCWWEGNPSKESVQECMTFVTTLMKSITKWHEEYNEKQNDQELSDEQNSYNEQLSSIDEEVINDKRKALTYMFSRIELIKTNDEYHQIA